MEKIIYAPVLIPTLCRYEHFVRCVESLSSCTHAEDTELYVALDYPTKDSHWSGYKKIEEYLPRISGFAKVNIIKRKKNYGVVENYRDLISVACKKYDRWIFSEDDNEFSVNFLDYINEGLTKYKDNPNVISISGYNYPIDMTKYEKNVYASHCYSAWGVGRWKNKKLFYTRDNMLGIARSIKSVYTIYKSQPAVLLGLINMLNHKTLYGDASYQILLINNNQYCIFPKISKVRNWGHDGSGIHCGTARINMFTHQTLDDDKTFIYDDIDFNDSMNSEIRKYFNIRFSTKVKLFIQCLPYLLRLKN